MKRILILFAFSLFLFSCHYDIDSHQLFQIKQVKNGYLLKISTPGQTQIIRLSRKKSSNSVHIPVSRIIVFSSTHIGFVCKLGEEKTIVGLADTSYVCCTRLRKRFDNIVQVGSQISPNFEKIMELHPDIVFISGFGPSEREKFKRLEQAGIAVVPIMEYMESAPLSRAKWIEVFGAFFDKYDQAKRIYDSTTHSYESLKHKLSIYLRSESQDSPVVLVNIPYRGTWYIPGGQTYMAHFIKDAGGIYPWAETKSSASLPLSFEQVFGRAKNADILLNPNTAYTLSQVIATDHRLSLFKAVREGNVYNFILQKKNNCFSFWEKGVIEPDKVLQDLIHIFYPGLKFSQDTMFYYKKLN